MQLTLAKSVTTAVQPSQRVLQTAAMFGIGVDDARRITLIPPTTITLPQPGIVFITGPSGSGKSTILNLIDEHCRSQPVNVINLDRLPPLADKPLIDLFEHSLNDAAGLLALVGLGDAFVMLRSPSQLSDGQRCRLRLAQAFSLARAGRDQPAIILADEFTATLDRLTAAIIARNIRKWTRRAGLTFIAATTHDDLLEALQPDLLIHKGLGEELTVLPQSSERPSEQPTDRPDASPARPGAFAALDDLAIEPAATGDYRALAPFHYKPAKPGAVTSAYRLVHRAPTVVGRYLNRRSETALVGILLRTLPHLACMLRDHATANRYRGIPAGQSARLLNREIRTIARVVIHPQWRSLGLAVTLVKHALANPEPGTIYTEALAAMGRVHPFFERAGMQRYDRPPRAEHARLIDALEHLGIDPVMLASPRLLQKHIAAHSLDQRLLYRELCRWHRTGAGRSKRARSQPPLDHLLAAARDHLLTNPVYYLYDHRTPTSAASC